MELRQSTGHGIHVLILCAREPAAWIKVDLLARTLGLTATNTYKIVAMLKTRGFVVSKPGRTGGIRLAQPPADIDLGTIVVALERPQLRLPRKPGSRRVVVDGLDAIFDAGTAAMTARLSRHSLADIAGGRRRGR
jgi:Rrf2 family nitric oxide-sensitive transcriptional repressor